MQTLIVPDVHENIKKLEEIYYTHMAGADQVVMLGDFWDTFSPYKQAQEAAEWVRAHIHDDKFTFCWGNHDCHYAFEHRAFRCSGYSPFAHQFIGEVLTEVDWRRFKVFTTVGKFLASHAGFHP